MLEAFLNYGSHRVGKLDLHKNQGLELTYLAEGEATWLVDRRAERVPAGHLFFTLPWQAHGVPTTRQPEVWMQWLLVKLDRPYFRPASCVGFHPSLEVPGGCARAVGRALCAAPASVWPASALFVGLLTSLIGELQRPGSFSGELVRGLFLALVVELGRIVGGEGRSSPPSPAERVVMEFLRTLEARPEDPWTLEAMARRCGMRRTRFSEIVRRLTGDSPMRRLNRLRVQAACRLLGEAEASVLDIALRCGFGSSQYFARIFRQLMDIAPTEYRRRLGLSVPLTDPADIPWRSEEEERQRMEHFRRLDRGSRSRRAPGFGLDRTRSGV